MGTKFKFGVCVAIELFGVFIALLSTLNIRENLKNVFGFTGLGIILLAIIASGLVWRCPHCKKHLPRQGSFSMDYCPYCGEPID